MTISSTAVWEPTRDQVIRDALWECGMLNASQSPSATQIAMGKEFLSSLLHGLTNMGLTLQSIDRYALSLSGVSTTTPYVNAPADTADVEKGASARSSDGLLEVPMQRITRDEYQALTLKTSATGQPTQYYPEKNHDGSISIYLYPVADSSSWPYIVIPRLRKPRDLDTGTNTVDVPTRWIEAVTAGIAWKFSKHYKLPLDRVGMLKGDWISLRDAAINNETERGNLVLVAEPFMWQ